MSEDVLYEPLGDGRYASTSFTAGPWSATLQHGSPPAALLGGLFERHAARAGTRVTRFSLDFLTPVPVAELAIDVEVARPGAKVELLTASVRTVENGVPAPRAVIRASAWRMLAEEGRSPARNLGRPPPPLPAEPSPFRFFPGVEACPYAHALEWRFVEGGFDQIGPCTVWSRSRMPIVRGEAISPLQRLLVMVDSANGVSTELSFDEFTFVPVNLTVTVHRHPEGEWVGMEAKTSMGSDGIGLTEARLFDQRGDIGCAVQSLFISRR